MSRIICVDLDDTLIKTDLTAESILYLFKDDPKSILQIPLWFISGGRANLKREIAKRVDFDVDVLPFNEEVLAYIRIEKERGAKIVLATASDQVFADKIKSKIPIIDEAYGSDSVINLKGKQKLKFLQNKFGKDFTYLGDSTADFHVWQGCAEAVVVSSDDTFISEARRRFNVGKVFKKEPISRFILIKAMRIHQWVKNLLIFLPLVLAHSITDLSKLWSTFLAFISFSLCSSGVYLFNDLLDIRSDRQHSTKKERPFAKGALKLVHGLVVSLILFASSFVIAGIVNYNFSSALFFYLLLTMAYSIYLKQIAVIDILVLASLYTTRILAGGYASEVRISQWLLLFSMFIFLSLACVKRYSELWSLRKNNKERAHGRGYVATDLELIAALGGASGYLSVLVFALYLNSIEISTLYTRSLYLWSLCPVLLYWISRIWLLAHRGIIDEDPIVFALKDIPSYAVVVISLIVAIFAI